MLRLRYSIHISSSRAQTRRWFSIRLMIPNTSEVAMKCSYNFQLGILFVCCNVKPVDQARSNIFRFHSERSFYDKPWVVACTWPLAIDIKAIFINILKVALFSKSS